MVDIFTEISVIIVIATLISCLMRLLKQPLIIGYILTGIIVSPYFLNIINSIETIETFSQIGIAFLLFIVGLNLSPRVIKEVGKVSVITGVGQVVFTALIGYYISILLGFNVVTSLYVAVALTFSSTIIIMKLLSDKQDLDKLYGKISIGFLIVQDIIAIFILLVISSLSSGLNISSIIFNTFISLLFLIVFIMLISKYILPRLSSFFAKSQEILFLFSIAWGLGLGTLFDYFGFSIEIGALVAGVALSMTPYHHEISSKMRTLRDFFIILFFILLGANMLFEDITGLIWPAVIFSLFILIGNPLIVMILMGLLGYSKRNGFMAGLTVAQISEFSLILIALGVNLGHLSNEILSLVTLIGLVTIGGSTYFILYSDRIYNYISSYLWIFERKIVKKDKLKTGRYDIILFGYNRVGYDFLNAFKKLKKKFMVVDYNPDVIKLLSKQKIRCRYGDADDDEFLDTLSLSKVKMIVSTMPDFETNLLLIKKSRQYNKKAIIMVISHNNEEASILYDEGATYVVMPHYLGGSYASMLISKYGLNVNKFLNERGKHIGHIRIRKILGHEHPRVEKNYR